MNAVTDPLALMNLLAVPHFAQAAISRDLHIFVLPETAQEIQRCGSSPLFDQMRTTLEASTASGQIQVMDVRSAANPELYCHLVPTLHPVTARALMVADTQEAFFVTESPKLLSVLAQVIPGQQSTTGLSIVKQWIEEERWGQQEITAFINRTSQFFQPTRNHPLREWWFGNVRQR